MPSTVKSRKFSLAKLKCYTVVCSQNHKIISCDKFKSMDAKQRLQFVKGHLVQSWIQWLISRLLVVVVIARGSGAHNWIQTTNVYSAPRITKLSVVINSNQWMLNKDCSSLGTKGCASTVWGLRILLLSAACKKFALLENVTKIDCITLCYMMHSMRRAQLRLVTVKIPSLAPKSK